MLLGSWARSGSGRLEAETTTAGGDTSPCSGRSSARLASSSLQPTSRMERSRAAGPMPDARWSRTHCMSSGVRPTRSEEHTSELQSQSNLVCRLLLEKKKKKRDNRITIKQRATDASRKKKAG